MPSAHGLDRAGLHIIKRSFLQHRTEPKLDNHFIRLSLLLFLLFSHLLSIRYRQEMEINTSEKKIRIAVIGSGLAGLTAAYLLARDTANRYSVEIFEMVCDRFHSP